MNKKLIAAAVSAAVVVPVASQADATVYGNITNALEFESRDDKSAPNDTRDEYSTTEVSTVGSRLGVRASSDLGNGLTANGVYELTITSNNTENFGDTRLATVGLSGGFGSVNIGQQWTSFYNAIGSLVSPNYTVSVGYGGSFRTGNTLKYTNSFGPVALGVDIRVDDDEGDGRDAQGDGFGIGATISPTSNISVGVAFDASDGQDTPRFADRNNDGVDDGLYDSGDVVEGRDAALPVENPDEEIFGVAVRATFGDFWGSVGYQVKEVDSTAQINCTVMDSALVAATGTTGSGTPPDCSGITAPVATPHVTNPAIDLTGVAAEEEVETEYVQLWVGGTIAEKTTWNVGFGTETEEEKNDQDDVETERFAFAVNHHMGGGLRLFLEHQDTSVEVDNNPDSDVDTSRTLVGMRLNF